jgi:ATP-dependent Clp protease protease subunit
MTELELHLAAEAQLFGQQYQKELLLTDKTSLEVEDLRAKVEWHRYSDARNRVYNFLGPITLQSVSDAAQAILGWDRESKDPITLRLMSPGGEVPSGLYLYDLVSAMAKLGTPVRTIALGNANSMAAVVLQAGTHRLVGPNSWITLHEVSVSGNPYETMTVTEKEEQDKTIRRINSRLVRILASRANMSIEKLSKNLRKKEWTLEPEEAIAFGFADEIGYK